MDEDLKSPDTKFWKVGDSLVIQSPDFRIIKMALLWLFVFFLVGELFFRVDSVQESLTPPGLGSRHRQFEIQVGRLDKLVNEGEPINCIFLGNSMIWLGVDPLIVDQVFQSQTGEQIHCFNFGVSALPASSAGVIAPMLVERYHPKLLIYGTFARDYAIPAYAEDAYAVTNTPWLSYQNGDFSFTGWLYDRSHFFQNKGHMRNILYMDFEDVLLEKNAPKYQAYGLDPKYDVRIDVRQSPDFEIAQNRDPVKWLTHYTIQQENLDGLRQVIEQSQKGVQVIVIEMPFYETAFDFFANGKQDYDAYVLQVDRITAKNGILFWGLDDQPSIGHENWWDYFHLNIHGVNLFSRWIGNQLAHAYIQDYLRLTSTNHP